MKGYEQRQVLTPCREPLILRTIEGLATPRMEAKRCVLLDATWQVSRGQRMWWSRPQARQ